MIGRDVLFEEEASANYRLREVKYRRSGEVRWEVLDATSGLTVVGGLADRQEALRVIRGWERLSLKLGGGLAGDRLLNLSLYKAPALEIDLGAGARGDTFGD